MIRTPLSITPADAEDAAAGLHHTPDLDAAVRAFVARADHQDALADRVVAAGLGVAAVAVVLILALGL